MVKLIPFVFERTNKSCSYFWEADNSGKFEEYKQSVPKIFCDLNYQLKNLNRSQLAYRNTPLKGPEQYKNSESNVFLSFSRCVPLGQFKLRL